MKKLFSQRIGLKEICTVIHSDSMDENLRTALWNVIYSRFFMVFLREAWFTLVFKEPNRIFILLWTQFLNLKIDEIPTKTQKGVDYIKDRFFKFEWFEVYDIVELLIENSDDEMFIHTINIILEENLSGYRVISKEIVPIISEPEIQAVESALKTHSVVSQHLQTSLKLLSNKKYPDYRKAIKESISAVEAFARMITGNEKVTLGSALSEIEKSGIIKIHKA